MPLWSPTYRGAGSSSGSYTTRTRSGMAAAIRSTNSASSGEAMRTVTGRSDMAIPLRGPDGPHRDMRQGGSRVPAAAGGRVSWHAARARGQRSRNGQPTTDSAPDSSTGAPSRTSSAPRPSAGAAARSAWEYGCSAADSGSPVGSSSTIRPPNITATRAATRRTTWRLWVTKTIVRPSSSRRSSSRFRICAWIETSRALDGLVRDEDVRLRGDRSGDADPLALPARELRGVALGSACRQPDHVEQLHARERPPSPGAPVGGRSGPPAAPSRPRCAG